MTCNEMINYLLASNHMVLNRAVAGVTHKESLRALQQTGNNMNWILGHILVSRNSMCNILDHGRICDESYQKLYGRGTESNSALPFEQLLDIYNKSQKTLTENVQESAALEDDSKSKELTFLCFHEAYHVGQLGILRKMLGKEGVAG